MRWIDGAPTEPLAAFLAAVEGALRRECFLAVAGAETQFAEYDAGAGYERHLDALRGDDARVVTTIVYVHDRWSAADGGVLRAWLGEDSVDIEPLPGRAVLFRSDLVEHAVLPAHGPRAAYTRWSRRRS